MHGPVYITDKQVKLMAKAKSDVVIHDARPDGRLRIQTESQLDGEVLWYDANGKPLDNQQRRYRMLAVKHFGDAEGGVFSDHGVQLLPVDPDAAREEARNRLLPEVDGTEFILVPMAGDEVRVPAETAALPEGMAGNGVPKLVTFDTSEWDEARVAEMGFKNELWVKVKSSGIMVGGTLAEGDAVEHIGIVSAYVPTEDDASGVTPGSFVVDLQEEGKEVGTLRGVPFEALTVLGVKDE